MCGISGVISNPGNTIPFELMKRMGDQMTHRGPDATGYFSKENVGMIHRRLKIIDLSEKANQPMFNETGDVGVIYNGEIYNFLELRQTLESSGHQFQCNSDTEVIIHSFEEWGTEAFKKFNGIFAFALWDWRQSQPIVYLVRDRFGAKPLFYSAKGHQFAFASEIKPLLEVPWIDKTIDRSSLFAYLKLSHVPTPTSLIQGVQQVQPGYFIRIEKGQFIELPFWKRNESLFESPRSIKRSEDDWLDELDSIFKKVISRQVISDVPLGCFLSGGIDSSLMVAYYGECFNHPLQTFSIGYQEDEFDETPFARFISKIFKTEHHELLLKPEDYFDLIPEVPVFFDQPMADPTQLSSLLLCRFAKQKVTVALAGDGGDELFFGYTYQQMLYHARVLAMMPDSFRIRIFQVIESLLPKFSLSNIHLQRLKKFAEIFQFRNSSELFQYFVGTIGPMRLDKLANLIEGKFEAKIPLFDQLSQEVQLLPWDQQIAHVFIRTFLLDTVLVKTDRSGMAFGLEARVPFLDNEMTDFSARLPFDLKYKNGVKKYILRKLLARKLKKYGADLSISQRKKQGFSIPIRDWFRGDLKYLIDEYLSRERLKREGYFNPLEVKRIVTEHQMGKANHSHLLNSLVAFQMWKERFFA